MKYTIIFSLNDVYTHVIFRRCHIHLLDKALVNMQRRVSSLKEIVLSLSEFEGKKCNKKFILLF